MDRHELLNTFLRNANFAKIFEQAAYINFLLKKFWNRVFLIDE